MGAIGIVDDHPVYAERLKSRLQALKEDGPTYAWGEVEFITLLNNRDRRVGELACLIVDLELDPGSDEIVNDFGGRDRVLSAVRRSAPWLPVILTSRWFTKGDLRVLAEATPYDFDAVLPKTFFEDKFTNVNAWTRVRQLVAKRRVASLTGRSLWQVDDAMLRRPTMDMSGGLLDSALSTELFEQLLAMLDLGDVRIVVDKIAAGLSGAGVAHARRAEHWGRTGWLIKWHNDIGKLWRETQAHGLVLRDGLTRRVSVPLRFPGPVVWEGYAMIAYEFEENANPLIDAARDDPPKTLSLLARGALQMLYRGGRRVGKNRANVLKPIAQYCPPPIGAGAYFTVGRACAEGGDLDSAAPVYVACRHGDLHGRNVLLHHDTAVLIDFAHYEETGQGGVPLLDIAQLAVDLACAGVGCDVEAVVSGKAWAELYRTVCLECGITADANERDDAILFQAAAILYLRARLEYKLPAAEAKEIRVALGE